MFSRTQHKILPQIFSESMVDLKVIFKSIISPDDINLSNRFPGMNWLNKHLA